MPYNEKSMKNLHQFTQEERLRGAHSNKMKARERRKNKEDLNNLLKMSLRKGDIKEAEDILALEGAEEMNITVQTAINIAMIKRALCGDVQAAQYIRDTVGDKPSDRVELDQSLTIETWAKNHDVKL